MARLVEMRGGVAVRRVVAAADLPALVTHPQVHPPAADLEALLAALDRLLRLEGFDGVQMSGLSRGHAPRLRPRSNPESAQEQQRGLGEAAALRQQAELGGRVVEVEEAA